MTAKRKIPPAANSLGVGIDLGGDKFAVVAASSDNASPQVVGVGEARGRGFQNGQVVDLDQATEALSAAAREAELMAGVKIGAAAIAVSGPHIETTTSTGMVKVQGEEVTEAEVRRIKDMAQAVKMPDGKEILHAIEQDFEIDGQSGVRRPEGMAGARLEGRISLALAQSNALTNLEKCARRAGLDPSFMHLGSLAAAEAALTADEKTLGVCLADIGADTTDIAVFHGGALVCAAGVSIAGRKIDNDIARVFHISLAGAQDIKRRHGVAAPTEKSARSIDAAGESERELPLAELQMTIAARVSELFAAIEDCLPWSGEERKNKLAAGIVLTGGGGEMAGIADMARERFMLPVRVGIPRYRGDMSEIVSTPRLATALGLALIAARERTVDRERGRGDLFSRLRRMLARLFGEI